uniref:Anthranilate synthase component 2 n=1 Tax=Erythrotrichia carnea TaxID=35151 RepID=A0A1C9CED0_9RHOD|nr:anthranilate synthase component 2 [Erythrotrichia carnea]AOM66758.1 anthranilate synthase component 2 [Erythrotrichia carnea]
MILIIDNYDSFTYNLVQYVGEMGYDLRVIRNDKISILEILDLQPSKIIISPGPGSPDESGISLDVITELSNSIPILGVCLGHQAIGSVYGASVVKATSQVHGKVSNIYHDGHSVLFKSVPSPFIATRYHSLIIEKHSCPEDIVITAFTSDGIVMSIEHKTKANLYGIQFHPESILTKVGKTIIKNFLEI